MIFIVTETDGYPIIECIERSDKTMIIGFQFHPEAAVVKYMSGVNNAENYMEEKLARLPFSYFIEGVSVSKAKKGHR